MKSNQIRPSFSGSALLERFPPLAHNEHTTHLWNIHVWTAASFIKHREGLAAKDKNRKIQSH